MSVFDDSQHGIWEMTYKYHERALVFNERNLHKVWDIAYDGYSGGKDVQMVNMNDAVSRQQFIEEMNDYSKDYNGPSVVPILLEHAHTWLPSPLLSCDHDNTNHTATALATAHLFIKDVCNFAQCQLKKLTNSTKKTAPEDSITSVFTQLSLNNNHQMVKYAILASTSNEFTSCKLMYQGTSKWLRNGHGGNPLTEITGSGHHRHDYVGVTAVRNGKHMQGQSAPTLQSYISLSK